MTVYWGRTQLTYSQVRNLADAASSVIGLRDAAHDGIPPRPNTPHHPRPHPARIFFALALRCWIIVKLSLARNHTKIP